MPFRSAIPPSLRDIAALRDLGIRRLLPQALLTGGIAGAVIGLFRAAYDHIGAAAAQSLQGRDLRDPAVLAVLFAVLFALGLAELLLLRLEPLIGGSGIPQVELMTRGQLGMRWWRVLPCKFAGTLLSLTAGLSVGREGPCIMMGATVGAGVGQLWHSRGAHNLPRFLVGGGVAGMTAAFGAPLAGMCFAFEEMRTLLAAPMLLFTGLCALSAWGVVEGLFGFGLVFPFAAPMPLPPWTQWWLAPAMGLCMGLLGTAYSRALMRLTLWQDGLRAWPRPARVLLPFLLAGLLALLCPQLLPGLGVSTLALESLPLPLWGLLGLLAAKLAWSCVSFASGVSGGILMPLLLMGALGGAGAASGLASAGLLAAQDAAVLLTLGMAGMFAAAVRAPLTGAALLLEMTGAFQLAPLVLGTAYIAAFTANRLGSEPVYDSLRRRCALQAAGGGKQGSARGGKV